MSVISQTVKITNIAFGKGLKREGDNVGVEISDKGDNLINLRTTANPGIYAGIEAPEEIRVLFVSSSQGNDSNKGTTSSAPLRTLAEAFKRLNDTGVSYTINLKAGDIFEVDKSVHWYTKKLSRSSLNILPYGYDISKFPDRTNKNSMFMGFATRDFPRPTIRLRKVVNESAKYVSMTALSAKNLYIKGIKIELYLKQDMAKDRIEYAGTNLPAFYADDIYFNGCEIRVMSYAESLADPAGLNRFAYRNEAVFKSSMISVSYSIFYEPSREPTGREIGLTIVHAGYTNKIHFNSAAANYIGVGYGEINNQPRLANTDNEALGAFRYNKYYAGGATNVFTTFSRV